MNWLAAERIIRNALEEDLGAGDITTEFVIPADARAVGRFICKSPGVLCGAEVARRAFRLLDPEAKFDAYRVDGGFGWLEDGTEVEAGTLLGSVECSSRALLSSERVALNFLQRLSGIATLARRIFQLTEQGQTWQYTICETRKTTPGLRMFEKYAVRVGCGDNHRIGLDSAVMLKDNHFALAGASTVTVVGAARMKLSHTMKMLAEATTLELARELIGLGVDIIVLDNFTPEEVRAAVAIAEDPEIQRQRSERFKVAARVTIEVSGGISEANISDYLIPGVDVISIGALTHSAPALDISLEAEAL